MMRGNFNYLNPANNRILTNLKSIWRRWYHSQLKNVFDQSGN
jgi:hypothetical protein